jgi:prepilin-type N-terminal cleavage/methylation domain-containing protein
MIQGQSPLMEKVPLTTKRFSQHGFSVVEVLLAVAIFGMLTTAVIGALVYGRASTADAGDRTRGNFLAEEGVEAVRNIRNAGYSNLIDGTYGMVKTGGVWTLSGSSDTSGIYSRGVTIASNGTDRKLITSQVSWNGVNADGQTSVVSELTNWRANLPKYWTTPSQYSGVDLSGAIAGWKVATSGSYAYVVRKSATGPNFFIINISTPTTPTVVGSLTLAGSPTNIAVSGNYAYVSNSSSTAELQIVNIATPTTPALSGTYNASGSAGALGVYAVGTTAYLTRGANGAVDEFVIVNAANPAAPTRVGGYGLAVAMNEVYVSGTTAYVASGSDTQEVLVINMSTPASLTLGTSINLTGTGDATTISGYGNVLVVGQGTAFYTVSIASALAPTVSGTVTMPGAINDVAVDATHNYAFAGLNFATGEFKVVNINNQASPAVLSTVDMTGTQNLTGVSYNAGLDVAPGASSNTALEAVIFGPN